MKMKCQLATSASAAVTSPARLRCCEAVPAKWANTTARASAATAAGRMRRMRRAQNDPRWTVRVIVRSARSSEVIRKPDRVKKVDTPR